MSVDRVTKLIALATKNSEAEEARTSAVQACRIIHERGLVVLAPNDPRLAVRPGEPASKPRRSKSPDLYGLADQLASIQRLREDIIKREQRLKQKRTRVILKEEIKCVACKGTRPVGARMWFDLWLGHLCGLCHNGVP